jgi:hypothetical protein
MKKLLIIGSIVAVLALILGVVGLAYARSQPSLANYGLVENGGGGGRSGNKNSAGPGMMGNGGRSSDKNSYGPGMMGGGWRSGDSDDYGPGMIGGGGRGVGMMAGEVQEYMLPALAQAFGFTEDELQARLEAGDTLWTIAEEQGLSVEQFRDKVLEARTAALDQMVADGLITQAQADLMKDHMTEMWDEGFGPGMKGGLGVGRDGEGLLHDAMVAGFADALGLTVDEIDARLTAGETMYQIATSTGLTAEQWSDLVVQVRTEVINQAVADGTLTQTQADWMLEHMQAGAGNGFGPGSGRCPRPTP